MTRARATLAVLGVIENIADALASADVDDADLDVVADALQAARNDVLAVALERAALDDGPAQHPLRHNWLPAGVGRRTTHPERRHVTDGAPRSPS